MLDVSKDMHVMDGFYVLGRARPEAFQLCAKRKARGKCFLVAY
jgi:hypothetical protein